MLRLLKALLALLFVAAGVIVAALNADQVTVDLWFRQINVPLGIALLSVLLLGTLLGGLAVAVTRISAGSEAATKPSTQAPVDNAT